VTPPRRTKGPQAQTRQRKIIDKAVYPDPTTVSDIEETPMKSDGRPARGRRSTNRHGTDQPELAGKAALRRKTTVTSVDAQALLRLGSGL
jgi:hypothetical protein